METWQLDPPDPQQMRRGIRLGVWFAAFFFALGVGCLLSGF